MFSRIVTLICLISLVMAAVSCGHKGVTFEKLQEAQEKIEDYPDSALSILHDIPYSELGDDDKALYGILYARALDMNHLDPDNDTIISHALEYYEAHEKIPERIIATYYRGRALQDGKNYPKALLYFYKSKELAERNGEYFWAGMSCRGIAGVYKDTYHYNEEVEYARKGYDYIKTSERQPYLNYALNDYCSALRDNGNVEMSIKISEQLLDSAYKYKDVDLLCHAKRNRCQSLVSKKSYGEALSVMTEFCSEGYANQGDSLLLSLILFENNRIDESEHILNEVSAGDDLLKSFIQSKIESRKGNYLKAISDINYVYGKNDSIVRATINHALTTPITEYLTLDRALKADMANTYRRVNILLAIVAVLIIGLVIYYVKSIRKRKNEEIDNKVLLAERLKDELEHARNDNAKSFRIVETLLSTQYEILDQLINIQIKTNDNAKSRKKIAETVTTLIKDLSIGGEKVKELENRVDLLFNNLFSDFKRDLPTLKETDYLLFLFSTLKISGTAISIFLKEDKVEAVYNRKRRLKDKIRQLPSTKSNRYLKYLY